jgi:hypothetical protein
LAGLGLAPAAATTETPEPNHVQHSEKVLPLSIECVRLRSSASRQKCAQL